MLGATNMRGKCEKELEMKQRTKRAKNMVTCIEKKNLSNYKTKHE